MKAADFNELRAYLQVNSLGIKPMAEKEIQKELMIPLEMKNKKVSRSRITKHTLKKCIERVENAVRNFCEITSSSVISSARRECAEHRN